MRKSFIKILLPLFIFLILMGCQANRLQLQKHDQRLFWTLNANGAEYYFFGSVHMGRDDFYPLPDEIEQAFDKSTTLFVEIDISKASETEMASKMMAQGMYPQGETVRNHIPEDLYRKLEEQHQQFLLMMPQAKPWLLALMISMTEMMKKGMNPEQGIDLYFLKQADEENKQIAALEDIDTQFRILNSMSDSLQVEMLRSTLENPESELEKFEELMDAWKSGDENKMLEIIENFYKIGSSDEFLELLLYQRNKDMAEKLAELDPADGPFFVVVGAAHLVGEKSVIDYLKKELARK